VFYDRIDAGQQLAESLEEFKDRQDAIVITIPRGGVVPAFIVAKKLHLPLEVTMIKKLGHPTNPEYAIGAVSMNGLVLNSHRGVSKGYIEKETKRLQNLLKERYQLYHGNKPPIEVKNKIAIVVDDGIATGKTLVAALELLRKENPSEIIVAVPVGPTDTVNWINKYADRVICLEQYDDFYAIGLYYKDFGQVNDEEVVKLMNKANQVNAS